jgi:hypothetical protein
MAAEAGVGHGARGTWLTIDAGGGRQQMAHTVDARLLDTHSTHHCGHGLRGRPQVGRVQLHRRAVCCACSKERASGVVCLGSRRVLVELARTAAPRARGSGWPSINRLWLEGTAPSAAAWRAWRDSWRAPQPATHAARGQQQRTHQALWPRHRPRLAARGWLAGSRIPWPAQLRPRGAARSTSRQARGEASDGRGF